MQAQISRNRLMMLYSPALRDTLDEAKQLLEDLDEAVADAMQEDSVAPGQPDAES